jgi:Tat protein secretion system quality control protein TatD with DNase activity
LNIVDSHPHLEVAQFDEDRATMLERAAGITTLLAMGTVRENRIFREPGRAEAA